jgi:cellulose synthase/poly-beta-1,6-N-acetylglucosamine synthase-like glycosyltransferase
MIKEIIIYISAYIGIFAVTFYLLGFLSARKVHHEIIKDRMPSVSVIIPAYNEEKVIANTIESAKRMDYPKDKFEIIVVDDGSKDQTYKIAKSFGNKYIKIFTKMVNGGKASALNYGIKKAKGEIIITMDGDTTAEPDVLMKMIPYFYDKEVMCVTPSMAVYKPRGFLQRIQQVEYLLGILLRKAYSNMNTMYVAPGAFSAYRKSFFEQYGYYQESGGVTEDLEMTLRIQYNQFKVENCPEAVVYTVGPNKFYPLLKQRRRWYHGLVTNLWAYRKMFSKKYGDLGTVVLPIVIVTSIISLVLTLYLIIDSFIKIVNDLSLLSSINFNFISTLSINQYLLQILSIDLSSPIFLVSLTFIIILLIYLIFAKSKIKKYTNIMIALPLFIIFYSLLYTFWWIISLAYLLFNKKVTWGKE